jgi:ABC-type sugar transport system ATPase subunit
VEEVVAQMVGRVLQQEEQESVAAVSLKSDKRDDSQSPILRVKNLSRVGAFREVSFDVRAGEIVGVAGLVGSGRSEVARCIFGLDARSGGAMWVEGREYSPRSPHDAIRAGLALVPEDRRHQGLIAALSVRENLSLPALAAGLADLSIGGVVRNRQELAAASTRAGDLAIKAESLEAGVETLSGGNQQKVVIGKWLTTQPRLFIVDEPTQGVDVGAKAQVHRLLRGLAARGFGVLMISSDLPEVLHLSHRILVMRAGEIVGELARGATPEAVMRLAAVGN